MTKQERCPIHKPGWYSECSTCNPDTQGQPEQTTSEREREIAEFRKALSCLYIAVDKSVADDVNAKANAVLAQLDEARLKLAKATDLAALQPQVELPAKGKKNG